MHAQGPVEGAPPPDVGYVPEQLGVQRFDHIKHLWGRIQRIQEIAAEYESMLADPDKMLEGAAVRIQSLARGKLDRHRVHDIKVKREEKQHEMFEHTEQHHTLELRVCPSVAHRTRSSPVSFRSQAALRLTSHSNSNKGLGAPPLFGQYLIPINNIFLFGQFPMSATGTHSTL